MPSTEPSIPKKPFSVPIISNFSVSSVVGSLNYFGPNTFSVHLYIEILRTPLIGNGSHGGVHKGHG